jgi:uncharacterized protein YukE
MKKDVKINNILFDNVVFTNGGENLIFTSNIKEEFFGIYTVEVFGENVLCEQFKENYVNCSVKINNNIFENVIFRLIKSSVERIVINENLIDQPYVVGESSTVLDEKDLIIENLRLELNKIKSEKQRLKKHLLTEKTQSVSTKDIQPYKEQLLKEFIVYTNEQKELLTEGLATVENKLVNIIENKFLVRQQDLKITLLEEAVNHFKDISAEIYRDIIPDSVEATEKVFSEKYNNFQDSIIKSVSSKISELNRNFEAQIKQNYKNIQETVNKTISVELNKLNEKIKNIEKIKTSVVEESSDKKLITETEKKINKLTKRLDEYGGRINSLLNEKKNLIQITESNKQYIDAKFNQMLEESRRYSRTVSEIYAGGGSGSVAQQFAAGGTMSGSLDVTGQILSGGNDLLNIFAGEGGGDSNTLDGGTT